MSVLEGQLAKATERERERELAAAAAAAAADDAAAQAVQAAQDSLAEERRQRKVLHDAFKETELLLNRANRRMESMREEMKTAERLREGTLARVATLQHEAQVLRQDVERLTVERDELAAQAKSAKRQLMEERSKRLVDMHEQHALQRVADAAAVRESEAHAAARDAGQKLLDAMHQRDLLRSDALQQRAVVAAQSTEAIARDKEAAAARAEVLRLRREARLESERARDAEKARRVTERELQHVRAVVAELPARASAALPLSVTSSLFLTTKPFSSDRVSSSSSSSSGSGVRGSGMRSSSSALAPPSTLSSSQSALERALGDILQPM